jgi:hypothetical protein
MTVFGGAGMANARPYQGRIAPELLRWCDEAASGARTSALVRVRPMASTDDLVRRLEAAGADVSSSGPGVIIIVIDCEAVPRVAVLDDVLAVEPVRPYQIKPDLAL